MGRKRGNNKSIVLRMPIDELSVWQGMGDEWRFAMVSVLSDHLRHRDLKCESGPMTHQEATALINEHERAFHVYQQLIKQWVDDPTVSCRKDEAEAYLERIRIQLFTALIGEKK